MTVDLRLGDSALVLKEIADESVDLTVTSPPYDNLRKYNGYTFDFETIARELYRVTKQGGVVVWVVGDATVNGSESLTSFKQAIYFREQCGFNLHDTMIYEKSCYMPLSHKRYENVFEYMFVFCKGGIKTFNAITKPNAEAGKTISGNHRHDGESLSPIHGSGKKIKDFGIKINVWKYNTGWNHSYSDKNIKGHTAVFPEELARDHIVSWCNEGDTVLDPFLGSGTTGKMAVLLNRHFIGIEISPEYLDIARRRISDAEERARKIADAPKQIGIMEIV